MTQTYRFADFRLDPADRRLSQGGAPVDVNGRYLDALLLLVREQGRLVSKDRFMAEVWRGVPVTDEALTQCVRTLRRQLGDTAAAPRFIETVPRHGYRFVASVEEGDGPPSTTPAPRGWRCAALIGAGGTVGGGMAGLIGGIVYGFAGASQPLQPGMGAVSVLLVLVCLSILVALTGAAGVAFGIAAGRAVSPRWPWSVGGGAAGGLLVGGIVKLLGLDAFNLLFGRAPADIAGAGEGALLGAAIGWAAWFTRRAGPATLRRSLAVAGAAGAIAGIAVALLGGCLMAGSLDLLSREFPASRLRLDRIGALFGEPGFGPVARTVTAGCEGLLFAACIVAGLILTQRSLPKNREEIAR